MFLIFLLVLSCAAFLNIKPIVHLLEVPVQNVKFFQLSPGDYFISTVKNSSLYWNFVNQSLFTKSINVFLFIPGLNAGEKKTNITTTSGINRFVFLLVYFFLISY